MDWTQKMINMLSDMWADGYPTVQIAETISEESGRPVSKNAAIAKASREALGPHPAASQHHGNKKGMIQHKPRRKPISRPPALVFGDYPIEECEADQMPPDVPLQADCRDIGIMELTWNTCRWPISDDPSAMTYCGAITAAGSVYCAAHHRVAYNPPPKRKRGVRPYE